jgi:hypothetical protein
MYVLKNLVHCIVIWKLFTNVLTYSNNIKKIKKFYFQYFIVEFIKLFLNNCLNY